MIYQALQLVRLTDRWLNFCATRMSHLNGQHLLSSAINKKGKTWKEQYGSTQGEVQCMVHEKNIKITVSVC